MAKMSSLNVEIAEAQVAIYKQAEVNKAARDKEAALKLILRGLRAQKNGGKK